MDDVTGIMLLEIDSRRNIAQRCVILRIHLLIPMWHACFGTHQTWILLPCSLWSKVRHTSQIITIVNWDDADGGGHDAMSGCNRETCPGLLGPWRPPWAVPLELSAEEWVGVNSEQDGVEECCPQRAGHVRRPAAGGRERGSFEELEEGQNVMWRAWEWGSDELKLGAQSQSWRPWLGFWS